MMTKIRAFLRDNRAATAIEYGLILALIGVASMIAMRSFGGANGLKWNNISNEARNNM